MKRLVRHKVKEYEKIGECRSSRVVKGSVGLFLVKVQGALFKII